MHASRFAAIARTITAYYQAICFPPGGQPDWEQLRQLFHPAARFLPIDQATAEQSQVLDLDGYFQRFHRANIANQRYELGFYERETQRRVTSYGAIAHVWSIYEALHTPADKTPSSRGVCSLELIDQGQQWIITCLCWQGSTSPLVDIAVTSQDEMGS